MSRQSQLARPLYCHTNRRRGVRRSHKGPWVRALHTGCRRPAPGADAHGPVPLGVRRTPGGQAAAGREEERPVPSWLPPLVAQQRQ